MCMRHPVSPVSRFRFATFTAPASNHALISPNIKSNIKMASPCPSVQARLARGRSSPRVSSSRLPPGSQSLRHPIVEPYPDPRPRCVCARVYDIGNDHTVSANILLYCSMRRRHVRILSTMYPRVYQPSDCFPYSGCAVRTATLYSFTHPHFYDIFIASITII